MEKQFLIESIKQPWATQATCNFYRARWHDSTTLVDRLNKRGWDFYELADAFNWERTPQGASYWELI